MGLGKLFENKELTKKGGKNFKAPSLSFSEWKDYVTSIGKVTTQDPEYLLQLGASYAVNGKDILYFYEEGVPGDSPDPLSVINMLTGNIGVS
jgi:hypothetical protein